MSLGEDKNPQYVCECFRICYRVQSESQTIVAILSKPFARDEESTNLPRDEDCRNFHHNVYKDAPINLLE